ncbi:L-2-hydroxyglutarate oxidase [Sinorhizobium meliloti]|uniref:Hydroxyglutarate oxidase n=1 Tax=Rhizobium meliloti TaxID=382 RepID=A0A2J0YZ35_RHIML|nr:L-2-hydroxyglutarate oxidase [Sinorhizobium meliloti]PJR13434.1 hydroxyglutarate oxidase [Sinorhizobium meliloti]
MAKTYHFIVIGGGIVGLATIREILRRRKGASALLIEKEAGLGQHQTGHNSGVIHAGIYYKPGSLKAELCKRGAALTKEFCLEKDIAFQTPGKLVVATNSLEVERLEKLHGNAAENHIEVQALDAAGLKRLEPNITGLGALRVPSSGIVDYGRICAAMAEEVRENGGVISLNQRVDAIHEHAGHVAVTAGAETVSAGHLIACAGLQSDRLAKLAGMKIDHRIIPFRGEYYDIAPARSSLVEHMIYPVPDPDLPFLGIHLTPTIDGGLTVGPNAVLGLSREGYARLPGNMRDIADYLGFPGFWHVARKNWRSGLSEFRNSLSKRRYLDECRKYCPSLTLDDLRPREAGIRAQAVLNDGTLLHDFLFLQTERMLHVCNAPSPAATSAMPIAEMIVDRLSA